MLCKILCQSIAAYSKKTRQEKKAKCFKTYFFFNKVFFVKHTALKNLKIL